MAENDPMENLARWTKATEDFVEGTVEALRLLSERLDDLSRRVDLLESSIPWLRSDGPPLPPAKSKRICGGSDG